MQWTAVETGSGIRDYDLDVSADGGANWTRLLTETQDTSYTFTGTLGVAYTFRVRATDNVNNTSAWVQAEARTVVVKKYYSVAGAPIAPGVWLWYTWGNSQTQKTRQGKDNVRGFHDDAANTFFKRPGGAPGQPASGR